MRQANADAAGVSPTFDDLSDHDAEWLKVVEDIALVMEKARDCEIPIANSKRKRETELASPRKKPGTRTGSSEARPKVRRRPGTT